MSKRTNELSVRSLTDPHKVYRVFRAISGSNFGDKVKEGDKKTPEGIYFVEARVPKDRMKPIHGAEAFELNYPNPVDRILKRTGHGIWIHGVDKDDRMNKRFDTLGCVAVSNKDIVDLGRHFSLKNTPIVIVDEETPDKPIGIETEGGPLQERVKAWAAAWSSMDVDAYLKFYSPDFYSRNMNITAWERYKRRLVKTYKTIQVTLSDLKVLRHGKYSVAIFMQHYRSDRYKADSLKRLYLVGEGSEAQILAEEVAEESAGPVRSDEGEEVSPPPVHDDGPSRSLSYERQP
jgi:murein L,D-transpeptidase YafK